MASIKKKKLADFVIEEIKQMVLSGELKEGTKLPNQNEFSAQLGVSRSSLREALHTLTLMGVVEQSPGLGTIIRSDNLALWTEQLSPPLVSDVRATSELLVARRFIELGVTKLAVENATAEDVEKIGGLITDMELALKEGRTKDYSELDMTFHHEIAKASHNRFMVHMFITISGLMEQFIKETFEVIPGLLKRSLKFHLGVYEGIKERNVEKATKNMKDHIQNIDQALKKYYKHHVNKN